MTIAVTFEEKEGAAWPRSLRIAGESSFLLKTKGHAMRCYANSLALVLVCQLDMAEEVITLEFCEK